eukprot:scaffold910_cov64-Cylindrotheca_fusiformis.AAC.1
MCGRGGLGDVWSIGDDEGDELGDFCSTGREKERGTEMREIDRYEGNIDADEIGGSYDSSYMIFDQKQTQGDDNPSKYAVFVLRQGELIVFCNYNDQSFRFFSEPALRGFLHECRRMRKWSTIMFLWLKSEER